MHVYFEMKQYSPVSSYQEGSRVHEDDSFKLYLSINIELSAPNYWGITKSQRVLSPPCPDFTSLVS